MNGQQEIADDQSGGTRKYYGKYRSVVMNNLDPEQRGRIQVICPDVSGLFPTTWALPCLPLTGRMAGTYFVPTVGTGVWVEFEQGNPNFPIYVGGFWGDASEVPGPATSGLPISPNIVIQSPGQNSFVISDMPGPTGGIRLSVRTGASIEITDVGIKLDNGRGATITLLGNTVSINNGALTVL